MHIWNSIEYKCVLKQATIKDESGSIAGHSLRGEKLVWLLSTGQLTCENQFE